MCTNYVTTPRDGIPQRLGILPPTFDYRDELWPGNKGPILIGDLAWRPAVFGLIPFFSRDGKDFRRTYNARAETVDSRPSYRGPWRRRQLALVPMQAFFEPNYETGSPVRWRIGRRDGEPFTVAAIWDRWQPQSLDPDEPAVHSFSMLTINADAHPLMRRFHPPDDEKRSLVVIPPGRRDAWLAGRDAQALLQPMDADAFGASPAPLPPRRR